MRNKRIVNPTKKTITWSECSEMALDILYRKGKYNKIRRISLSDR